MFVSDTTWTHAAQHRADNQQNNERYYTNGNRTHYAENKYILNC